MRPCTGHILDRRASSPMLFGALRERGEHARASVPFRMKSIVGFYWNPVGLFKSEIIRPMTRNPLTPRMSRASTTLTQSLSPNLNADHGMCFMG